MVGLLSLGLCRRLLLLHSLLLGGGLLLGRGLRRRLLIVVVIVAAADQRESRRADDLIIVVDVLPAGANATIDFGVFRGGDDENGDGLADSRPDLAAIAFREASEETGAGVMNFFRLQFARDDLTGLVTDPDDPAFDLVEWDSLSRLEAQVGAQVDAPFLLVDGGNEMNAGLTFNNGMQLNMDADGLSFQGTGDVGIQSLVADEVQADQLSAETSQLTSSDIDALTVNPVAGVRGAGFDRLDQSADITRIDGELADHDTRITANLNSITANTADIATNRSNIASNTADIATNRSNIASNTTAIAANAAASAANRSNISTNRRNIAANAAAIRNIPSIPSCTPTRSAVISRNPGRVYYESRYPSTNRLCSSSSPLPLGLNSACYPTVSRLGASVQSYQTRNPQTLQCEGNTITFYSSCCVTGTTGCKNSNAQGTTFCAPRFPPIQ